jgi:hypothetical protein
MLTRAITTVLILLLGASYADAGLIDSHSVRVSEPSESAIESLLSDPVPLVDENPPREGVIDARARELAGMSSHSNLSGNVYSSIETAFFFHLGTGIAWYLSLDNAVLPPSPVLTGLLKPS